jgi:hypothetical protein
MPVKKTSKKNPVKKDAIDTIKDEIRDMSAELVKFVDMAKDKYEKTDKRTKQKVLAGIIGATALIAGAIGAKKIMKKK